MKLNKYIDHTLLKPDAKRSDIDKICDEAAEYGFMSVCVNPTWIGYVARKLEGTGVLPCCVVGFPLGATMPEVKAFETDRCIAVGAKEVDMVINIGAAKDGDWRTVEDDISAVVKAADKRATVKVIIETCLLTDEEKAEACRCAVRAGADFVKTSTGFSTGGATESDVALMRGMVGAEMGVKASGGIRDRAAAMKMVEAGASRIGASASIKIVSE